MLESDSVITQLEGGLNFILFGYTTYWGLAPFRPLSFLLSFIVMFSFCYYYYLGKNREGSIVKIAMPISGGAIIGSEPTVIEYDGFHWKRLRLALFYSILSAFHFGWRDMNFNRWISGLQFENYKLYATGSARFVSGVQSLISLYFIALWFLCIFAHPFG